MNDQAKYTVTLEFETSGADAEINNLRKLQEAVDGVAREGGIGEQSQVKLSKALHSTGVAAGDASSGIRRSEESIISLRYANYDLASTLFATSAAITAVGAASLIAFASQESAFTEVERIAGGSLQEIQNLRDELRAMSTDIPVAFGELSNIASLGAALDIPAEQLDEFTESVAKFAATTGVTVEAAATGFGKLAAYLQIPEEQFDALGSAILRAGNISVATEEQVLKFAQALALPGARIGFTTDQVVALGATLASFGNINVEGAGSALNRVTKNIERALAENGEDLQTWAATAGMSAEAFRVAWGSDVSGTFNRVIKGLSGNIEGLVGNLDALGIRNVRDQRIIEALALNYDKYNQILGETTSAWREGTYMNEAYGLVLDDLASKFQIMVNAITNFAAQAGSVLAPTFGALIDLIVKGTVALTEFIDSPVGESIVRVTSVIAGALAVWAALRGAIALATASAYAFSFIVRGLGGAGIGSALAGMIKAFAGIKTAADGATASTLTLRGALLALGRAVVVGAVLAYIAELIFNTGETAKWTSGQIRNLANWLTGIQDALGGWGQALGALIPTLGIITSAPVDGLRKLADGFDDLAAGAPELGLGLGDVGSEIQGLLDSLDDVPDATGDSATGMYDLGGAAGSAAQQVRTLRDYASDLSGVWGRAFEIRFGPQQTLDDITLSFINMREAAADAAKRIRDIKNSIRSLKADIQGLRSDIAIQEYFLSVAIEYGDTQRAAAIEADLAKKRAELAEKSAELSDKNKELNKEEKAKSKTLKGSSKAAVENRNEIRSLVSQYQKHIEALAASGLSEKELQKETKQLKKGFEAQAAALGYSKDELKKYTKGFDDVTVALNNVPRDITVGVKGLGAAQKALEEFRARLDKSVGKGVNIPVRSVGARKAGADAGTEFEQGFGRAFRDAFKKRIESIVIRSDKMKWKDNISLMGGYASGGYTGRGGVNEVAGVVHRGEFVVPQSMVNQSTGLPYADALGRMIAGVSGPAPVRSQAASPSGVATVALSPGSIQAIAQATSKILVLDGKIVADSSASQYGAETTVGAY